MRYRRARRSAVDPAPLPPVRAGRSAARPPAGRGGPADPAILAGRTAGSVARWPRPRARSRDGWLPAPVTWAGPLGPPTAPPPPSACDAALESAAAPGPPPRPVVGRAG